MSALASFRARSVGAVAARPTAATLALAALALLVVVLIYRLVGAAGEAAKSSFAGEAQGGGAPPVEPSGGPPPAEPPVPPPAARPAKPRGPCRRQWSPAAIAEAQGLATAGGLGYYDCNYGESRLVSAVNFENDSSAGLTDEALMNMARFGDAP